MESSQRLLKSKEWEAQITTWKASGLSVTEWCKKENIPRNTFRYWLNKASPKTLDPRAFVEIPDEPPAGIEIHYQGFQVHLNKRFDAELLMRCLKTLRSL